MPALTIYLDEKTLEAVSSAARREGSSVSGWARRHLAEASGDSKSWPDAYFDKIADFGGTEIEAPPESDIPLDEIEIV